MLYPLSYEGIGCDRTRVNSTRWAFERSPAGRGAIVLRWRSVEPSHRAGGRR